MTAVEQALGSTTEFSLLLGGALAFHVGLVLALLGGGVSRPRLATAIGTWSALVVASTLGIVIVAFWPFSIPYAVTSEFADPTLSETLEAFLFLVGGLLAGVVILAVFFSIFRWGTESIFDGAIDRRSGDGDDPMQWVYKDGHTVVWRTETASGGLLLGMIPILLPMVFATQELWPFASSVAPVPLGIGLAGGLAVVVPVGVWRVVGSARSDDAARARSVGGRGSADASARSASDSNVSFRTWRSFERQIGGLPSPDPDAPDLGSEQLRRRAKTAFEDGRQKTARAYIDAVDDLVAVENAVVQLDHLAGRLDTLGAATNEIRDTIDAARSADLPLDLPARSAELDSSADAIERAESDLVRAVEKVVYAAEVATEEAGTDAALDATVPDGSLESKVSYATSVVEEAEEAVSEAAATELNAARTRHRDARDAVPDGYDGRFQEGPALLQRAEGVHGNGEYARAIPLAKRAKRALAVEEQLARLDALRADIDAALPDWFDADGGTEPADPNDPRIAALAGLTTAVADLIDELVTLRDDVVADAVDDVDEARRPIELSVVAAVRAAADATEALDGEPTVDPDDVPRGESLGAAVDTVVESVSEAVETADRIEREAGAAVDEAAAVLDAKVDEAGADGDHFDGTRALIDRAEEALADGDLSEAREFAADAKAAAEAEARFADLAAARADFDSALPDGETAEAFPVADRRETLAEVLGVGDIEAAERLVDDAAADLADGIAARYEQELDLVRPLGALPPDAEFDDVDLPDAGLTDPDEQRWAIRQAVDARERALDELPARFDETASEASAAVDREDLDEARRKLDAARAIADCLAPLAEAEDLPDLAETVRAEVDELDAKLADAEDRALAAADSAASEANAAQSRGDDHLAAGERVAAVEAYAEARDAFETAAERARPVDGTAAEEYAERADAAAGDLRSTAESVVDRAGERLPDAEYDGRADAKRRLDDARAALDGGRYVAAATEAADAADAGRDAFRADLVGIRATAADRLEAAAERIADGEYVAAVEAVADARDRLAAAAELADDEGASDLAAEIRSTLDAAHERREDALEAADARVDDLVATAEEALRDADEAFREERHEAALEAYERAASAYDEAAGLVSELDLRPVDDLRDHRERADERAGYSRLAAVAADLRAAREAIPEDPGTAVDDFDEVRAEIDALTFDRDPLQERREELREESLKGRAQARVEVGRQRLARAEALYDDGDRYAARDAYEEAASHLESVREEVADGPVEPPDLLDDLLAACETNVDRIGQELAGVAGIRGNDGGIRRVGDPGDPLPSTGGDATAGEADPGGDSDRAAGSDRDPASTGRASAVPETDSMPVAERLDLLGEGGTAKVWHVRLEDGREAALKLPTWSGTIARRDVERFIEHAETWDRLDDHPNVVTVYDWGVDAEPWLLMEYVPDGTLAERVGAVSPRRALALVRDVADALVHARGVAHLDLKPENVLLDGDTPKLADWGLAKVAFARGNSDTQLGMSPPYAAPEQIDRTRGDRDERTDIYQLGVTAYELLTGQLPYPPDAPESLEARILAGDPTPPSELADVPPAVDEVVLRAMAPDRDDRYEAPIQFRDALDSTP